MGIKFLRVMMRKIVLAGVLVLGLVGCKSHYSVSGNDIVNHVKAKKQKEISPWKSTNWQTVMSMVEGKTLVAKDKYFCPDKDKLLNKECVKIAILEATKTRKTRRKLTSTIIYPAKKKIIKEEWGVGEYDIATSGLNIGILNIPLDDWSYPFEKSMYLHKDGKHLQYRNLKTKKILDITIIEKNNSKFLRDARNKNYKSINARGQRTLSQVIGGGIATYVAKTMKSGSNNSQSSPSHSSNNTISKTTSDSNANKYECKYKYAGLSNSEMKEIGTQVSIYATSGQEAENKGKILLNKQGKGSFRVSSISCR